MDLFGASAPLKMPGCGEYSSHWMEKLQGYRIVVPNGELIYVEQFFDPKVSDSSVEYFQENDTLDWRRARWKDLTPEKFSNIRFTHINWKQDSIKLYGRTVPLPRLTAWYGDKGKSYTYSGITSRPNGWNKGLRYLKQKIEQCAGVEFNSVLLNWYRGGEDHLNWHADNEKALGTNPIIASASFGETRGFLLRRNDDKAKKVVLPLKHGTLLLMRGELQHYWQHAVPRRKKLSGSRFNLTFRRIGVT